MNNPFTMVYDALWTMLEAHPQFEQDVKPGNRIKYNSDKDRDPLKQAVAAGDLPEVVLIGTTVAANLMSSSSGSSCTRQYTWLVSTGDFRYNKYLAQVEWEIFVAMLNWRTVLTALKYADKNFVKQANIVSATMGASDRERNRGIIGWSAAWTVEVQMMFTTSDLMQELSP